ncbi:MAG: hypothetical protein M0Z28_18250 [Rhodospirillales bacterium]|nr:hypothetical protein [Rhodospirillales bacterium]
MSNQTKTTTYYGAGRAAHADGTLYSDCPVGFGENGDAQHRREWQQGWRDAEQEARHQTTIYQFPSKTEWDAVDAAMGEHMSPTGCLRFYSPLPGVVQHSLEREWRGSLGTIWGRVPT